MVDTKTQPDYHHNTCILHLNTTYVMFVAVSKNNVAAATATTNATTTSRKEVHFVQE